MGKFRLLRDPVWYTNLLAALVMLISTFFVPLAIDQQGAVNAVALALAAIWSSWRVSDGQLALVVGLFKAIIAVGISFGLHLIDVQQLVIMTVVTAVGSGFVRTQVGAPLPPPPSTANPVTPVGGGPLSR